MDLVDSPQCQDELRKTRLGGKFRLHDSVVCGRAAIQNQDSCKVQTHCVYDMLHSFWSPFFIRYLLL